MTGLRSTQWTHANAVVLRETGVLLRGDSGSGKSALSLELIAEARGKGEFASLVGDDRIALENRNGRLIARPHSVIKGLIEVRGAGILSLACERGAVIRGVVDLSAEERIGGFRQAEVKWEAEEICGLMVPMLVLERRDWLSRIKIGLFLQHLEAR
ncbi:MAG: HPr kinase/phosphatase C-terminal domain-containing protein [Methylocystis sp.]